jgi:hypothetical protein
VPKAAVLIIVTLCICAESALLGQFRPVCVLSSCARDGLRPQQERTSPRVVGQVHHSDLHRRPDLALGPHQNAPLRGALVTEDMFYPRPCFGAPVIGFLLALVQGALLAALAVNPTVIALLSKLLDR